MLIRMKDTGAVVTHSEFRAMFPNTGFPAQLTEQLINNFGGDVVFEGPQAQPGRYQVAYQNGVEQIGGKWYTKHSIADMDDEAKAAADAQQAKSVRDTRNQKLKDSDWTQLIDAPVDRQAWVVYRQELRDISAQAGFPWDVQWPVQP